MRSVAGSALICVGPRIHELRAHALNLAGAEQAYVVHVEALRSEQSRVKGDAPAGQSPR